MRRKRLAVKILVYFTFFVALAGTIFSVGQSYRRTSECCAPADYQQHTAQGEVGDVSQANSVQSGNERQKNYDPSSKWADPMVLLTILLVIGVGVTAAIYYGQLREMRRTVARVGEQGETMKGQLTATQDTLSAIEAQERHMRQQTQIMRDSLVIGTRAYVGVHSIDFDPETDRIFLQVENIGKVPAENIDVFIEIEVKVPAKFASRDRFIERVLNDEPDAPQTRTFGFRHKFGAKAKLFPGNLKIKIRIPLEPWFREELPLIKSGDARLVARGNTNFMDGFNKDKNSPFAFRYRLGDKQWFPHPLLDVDGLRKRQIEEIPYFDDEDERETD